MLWFCYSDGIVLNWEKCLFFALNMTSVINIINSPLFVIDLFLLGIEESNTFKPFYGYVSSRDWDLFIS